MIKQLFSEIEKHLKKDFPELMGSMNPPTTPEALYKIEKSIGLKLPEAVRQLYLTFNGESKGHGLFFGLEFLSLEESVEEWKKMCEVAETYDLDLDDDLECYPEGFLKCKTASKHYFPISHDYSGNYLVVDLDPGQDGKVGQITNCGPDEWDRFVIAFGIEGFLKFILHHIKEKNYRIDVVDGVKTWFLKEPHNEHFLNTLGELDLLFK
ncbi:MAG: SMI1/KNR4 family protein [Bacteroidota bacterium]